MIRFGWWLGNETVTRETWGVCPENLNSQKLPQTILPKSSTSKNCPKDSPPKIYLPKTADSDVSPIQMVRCWSLASWAPTCCRPSMDSYLSCQGAISPLNDIFASIIIININAIVVIIITMMFNSDGKIMYISETASVHLGLSQVLIRNINCDNVKFFQPSKIQSLSKSWVSRTPLWWYHNPFTFKVELTWIMIYEYISTANNHYFQIIKTLIFWYFDWRLSWRATQSMSTFILLITRRSAISLLSNLSTIRKVFSTSPNLPIPKYQDATNPNIFPAGNISKYLACSKNQLSEREQMHRYRVGTLLRSPDEMCSRQKERWTHKWRIQGKSFPKSRKQLKRPCDG